MSNKKLTLDVLLKLTEKASAPLKKVMGGSKGATQAIKATKDQLRALQRQQKDISGFRKLQTVTKANRREFAEASEVTRRLKQQLEATETPTKKLTREYDRAARKSEKLRTRHIGNLRALKNTREQMEKAGIATRQLSGHEQRLKDDIIKTTGALERQQKQLARMAGIRESAGKVRESGGQVRQKAGRLAAQGAVAGAAGGYFFKRQFLDRAAEFETYRTTLETVEGTEAGASKAMEWVSTFAAKTPYDLAQVTDSYVKLRAYGLEPTNGLLKTLGDTGSAMGKPMMQAVEAIADAVTGENERLKEFGIKANTAGGIVTYEYTDRLGKQREAAVDASNRKLIESTLTAIWNEKYAGAMDKQSRTWRGMVSNAGDHWLRFTNMVMDAGMFDWMKGKLGGFLEKLNAMAADGRLQKWAETTGEKMVAFAKGVWATGTAIATATNTIAGAVGGWENLIYLLAAIKVLPLITSFFSLGKAIFTLSKTGLPFLLTGLKGVAGFLMANPIGVAIAAIAGGALLIWQNWEPIKQFFSTWWDSVGGTFSGAISRISAVLLDWSPVGLLYSALNGALSLLGVEMPAKFSEAGSMLINGLIGGITAKLSAAKEAITGAASSVSGWFKDTLGIRSPSRVFTQHGQDVMAGLTNGLSDNKKTLAPMMDVSKRLKAAGAGLAIGAAAMPAAAAQFDNRPPLQPASQQQAAGGNTYSITINPSPGMDEQMLARLVAAEIQKLEQRKSATARSSLSDDD